MPYATIEKSQQNQAFGFGTEAAIGLVTIRGRTCPPDFKENWRTLMFTLIAIAASLSIMTLAITALGILVLSIKDLIDARESTKLGAAETYTYPKAVSARLAA
jgi:hypothetical protein